MAFKDTKICILAGFSGFTKISGEVITRNIQKSGGTVVTPTSKDFDPSSLTCIIVPENAQLSKILSILNLTNLPFCPIVSPAWAIESHQKKELQPFNNFSYLNTQFPVKRLSSDDSPEVLKNKKSLRDTSPENNRTNKEMLIENDQTLLTESQSKTFLNSTQSLKPEFLQNKEKFAFSKIQGINHNEHITSVLEILKQNYALLNEQSRVFAYRTAISSLSAHPEKITCIHQADNLSGVGVKIKKKIQEILDTGSLKRVKAMNEQERLSALQKLSSIWGIGSIMANKLYSMGYKSISDLKKNVPSLLNENQKICLELHDELSQKIPRAEVQMISEIVVEYAKKLNPKKVITANTCGSFRRGKELCGDIDVLLTFDNILENKDFLSELVRNLQENGIVTHILVLSVDVKKHENFTFSGIAKLPNGLHRHLDIKIYPKKTYAWALMHFTGSSNFNRSIRLFAKTKGLKLTDEGLFPAMRNGEVTVCGGNLVTCYTEADIFRLFDMPYKPPEERDL